MHYKTITFNLKIPLNIQNFILPRAKFDIATLRAEHADFCFAIFLTFAPPPPPPIRKMDRRRCFQVVFANSKEYPR